MTNVIDTYQDFLRNKAHTRTLHGFEPLWIPEFLFDFQQSLSEWSIRQGRSAIFADCGLGKTPMQLVWGENVVRKTNKPVLVLTPVAVAAQTKAEGDKFDIEVNRVSTSADVKNCINVTNYEKLHHFDPSDFAGVVCDESSMLKAWQGKRRGAVTRFVSKMRYRLCCTATPAPNDFIEIGTTSEALGYMGQMDMLSMFFRSSDDMNHVAWRHGDFWNSHKWMFKAHSEKMFWRWVCSWARALRKPSDLGYEDGRFKLPPLEIKQHIVDLDLIPDGEFLPRVAVILKEQRAERHKSMTERCEKVAELCDHDKPFVAWCHLNPEGDLLEKIIPGAVQVKGAMDDDEKEEKLMAFSRGEIRVLVTKPTISGFGMNWQHCAHTSFFPSHSFEQYYQALRRFLRFGQTNTVKVDIVTTPGEAGVTANLQSKAEKAEQMFEALVREMHNSLTLDRSEDHPNQMELPAWVS